MEKENKGRAIALLPIGVFLIIFLGAGIVFEDFYAMPAIVAFLIALFVAFLQNKELSFNKKIEVIAKGVGEENIITMSRIYRQYLKNIQNIGQCVQHQMDIFIHSLGLNSLEPGKKPFRQSEIFHILTKNGWII